MTFLLQRGKRSQVEIDSTEHMENFKTEQVISNETVRSLTESVERLASIVAEIQTNVKSEAQDPCGKCKNDFLAWKTCQYKVLTNTY